MAEQPYNPALDPRSKSYVGQAQAQGIPVEIGNYLLVEFWEIVYDTTIEITARVQLEDGSTINLVENVAVTAGAGRTTKEIPLTPGMLISVSVRSDDAIPANNTCWAQASIYKGSVSTGVMIMQLIGAYIGGYLIASWPTTNPVDPRAGLGFTVSLAAATPAAGVLAEYTVPANMIIEVQAVFNTLVTDATVANRNVFLRMLNDSAWLLEEIQADYNHAASLTRRYTFGNSLYQGAINNPVINAPLAPMLLSPGYILRTDATNIQAGDQFGEMHITGRAWITPY